MKNVRLDIIRENAEPFDLFSATKNYYRFPCVSEVFYKLRESVYEEIGLLKFVIPAHLREYARFLNDNST